MITSRTAILGLGAMGTVLASVMLRAERPVTVWNRTQHRATPLVDQGADAADTAVAAIGTADMTVVCVSDNSVVEDLLTGADLAGRTIVNLTNGTPDESRALADLVMGHDGVYVDGAVLATPELVGTPGARILLCGPAPFDHEARERLSPLGEIQWVGSDAGSASLLDAALLSSMYGIFAGGLQAYALARTHMPPRQFAPLLHGWMSAMLPYVPSFGERVEDGQFQEDVTSSLGMQIPAIDAIRATARDAGVRDLLGPMGEVMRGAQAAGHGTQDISVLVEHLATGTQGPASSPEQLGLLLVERYNAQDLDGLVDLYEPDAVLELPDGTPAVGHTAIRSTYQTLMEASVTFEADFTATTYHHRDVALVNTRTRDNVTSELARRQPTGGWRWVVDRPQSF